MRLQLDPDVVAIVALAAAALALVLLVVVALLAVRLRRLRRQQQHVFGDLDENLLAVLERHEDRLAALSSAVQASTSHSDEVRELLRRAVCRVGVVRYDAFDDMGGALSFSAALLDEHGDGVVISAINGRSEARAYGKPIVSGRSDHHLTDEEVAAIDGAIEQRQPVVLPPEGGRRRRRVS